MAYGDKDRPSPCLCRQPQCVDGDDDDHLGLPTWYPGIARAVVVHPDVSTPTASKTPPAHGIPGVPRVQRSAPLPSASAMTLGHPPRRRRDDDKAYHAPAASSSDPQVDADTDVDGDAVLIDFTTARGLSCDVDADAAPSATDAALSATKKERQPDGRRLGSQGGSRLPLAPVSSSSSSSSYPDAANAPSPVIFAARKVAFGRRASPPRLGRVARLDSPPVPPSRTHQSMRSLESHSSSHRTSTGHRHDHERAMNQEALRGGGSPRDADGDESMTAPPVRLDAPPVRLDAPPVRLDAPPVRLDLVSEHKRSTGSEARPSLSLSLSPRHDAQQPSRVQRSFVANKQLGAGAAPAMDTTDDELGTLPVQDAGTPRSALALDTMEGYYTDSEERDPDDNSQQRHALKVLAFQPTFEKYAGQVSTWLRIAWYVLSLFLLNDLHRHL